MFLLIWNISLLPATVVWKKAGHEKKTDGKMVENRRNDVGYGNSNLKAFSWNLNSKLIINIESISPKHIIQEKYNNLSLIFYFSIRLTHIYIATSVKTP